MNPNRAATVFGLALAGVLVLSLSSCGECESCKTPAVSGGDQKPAPDAVYVVRGRVVMVPVPTNPTTEFRVHHEEIPTFKTPDGKVIGMHEMEMPFPVSDAKLLEGVQVGDLVEITFADWYKPMRTYKVTKLVKLPADTKLNLKDE